MGFDFESSGDGHGNKPLNSDRDEVGSVKRWYFLIAS